MLLVLDNFEQVIAAGPSLTELPRPLPRCNFLTSRAALHVAVSTSSQFRHYLFRILSGYHSINWASFLGGLVCKARRRSNLTSRWNEANAYAVAEICTVGWASFSN